MTKERIERIIDVMSKEEMRVTRETGRDVTRMELAIVIDKMVEGEIQELNKDKFCGIPMDSKDVDAKLKQYDYIPKQKLKPILDLYAKYKDDEWTDNNDLGWITESWQAIKSTCEEVGE